MIVQRLASLRPDQWALSASALLRHPAHGEVGWRSSGPTRPSGLLRGHQQLPRRESWTAGLALPWGADPGEGGASPQPAPSACAECTLAERREDFLREAGITTGRTWPIRMECL